MPSTATVTAFYVFSAGGKARASQVNNNFEFSRGHIIPVSPNTATAEDNAWDLGSSEYQFRNLYVKNSPIVNGANVSSFEVPVVFDGDNPPLLVYPFENTNLYRYKFLSNTDMDLRFNFEVPGDYTAGNQIKLDVKGWTDDTATGFRLQSVATLFQDLDNALTTSPSDVLTSTSDLTSPTTTGNIFSTLCCNLTDVNGLINSVSVTVGDTISVNLKRVGTATQDSMSGSFFLNALRVDLNG